MLKWKLRKSKNSPCILSNQIINKLQNTYFNIPGKGVRKFLSTSMPCEPSQEQRMDSANIQPLQFHKGTTAGCVFRRGHHHPRLQHTIHSFLWFNRDTTQMLYILTCQLWFSTSCDWILTLWNSMEKVCKKLIRSHYDSRAHLESPKIESNILRFSFQKWNRKGGSGQKGKISLSFSHTQPTRWSELYSDFL